MAPQDQRLREIAEFLAVVAPDLLARPERVMEVIEAVIARHPELPKGADERDRST